MKLSPSVAYVVAVPASSSSGSTHECDVSTLRGDRWMAVTAAVNGACSCAGGWSHPDDQVKNCWKRMKATGYRVVKVQLMPVLS